MGADDEKADEMPKVSGTGVPKASEEAPASDAHTEEEKREIEEAARNIEEHAKIDDPVEPPARNAPKNIKAAGTDDNNVDAALAFIPSTSKSILSRLFDPDRVQKKELWEHIKLVAPGPADQPPPGLIKWRTKGTNSSLCTVRVDENKLLGELMLYCIKPVLTHSMLVCRHRCGFGVLSQMS